MTDYASDKNWIIHKLTTERDAARAAATGHTK